MNNVLQIHKWKKYCGKFTGVVPSEVQGSSLQCLYMEKKKIGVRGRIFGTKP